MPAIPRSLLAVALGFSCLWQVSPAWGGEEEARRYFKNGVDLITSPTPNYQDAYYQFQLAYRESGESWKVLGNLGLCALKLERDQEAARYYELYLSKGGSDITPEERTAIEQDLLLLKGNLATIRVTSPVQDLKLLDERVGSTAPAQQYKLTGGELELSLRAGNHRITAINGNQRLTWEVVLEPKGSASHVFDFSEPASATSPAPVSTTSTPPDAKASSSGSGLRIGGYTALGLGAVGLGLGGYFLWQSSDYGNQADDLFGCTARLGGCSLAQRQQIRQLEDDSSSAKTRGVVTLVAGGVAAAAGVTLLVLAAQSSDDEEQPRALLVPWIGDRAVGVSGRF